MTQYMAENEGILPRRKNMKKELFCILWSMLLFLGACAGHQQEIAPATAPIVILHTNDVHAAIDEHIGYAGLAAYKNALEEKYGSKNVLLVDSGDAVQGGSVAMLTQGEAIIEIMNAVGYDYFALGNHEFDYKIPRLFELSKKLEAKIVSANFMRVQGAKNVYPAYEMYTVDGVDIAFVGVLTPETLTKASAHYFKDAKGEFAYTLGEDSTGQKLYTIVQRSVDAARAAGAEYVVALVHLGVDAASQPWRSTDLIAHVTGIDIMLDGHSHTIIEGEVYKDKAGKEVVLSQTGDKLRYIGQVIIEPSKEDGADISATLINKKQTSGKKDAHVQAKITAVKEEFAQILEKSVAQSEYDLVASQGAIPKARMGETNLGNLVADAYRILLDTQVGIVNGGSIRANVEKGDITFQNIIDLHPFGNYIMSMEVTGKTLKDALEMGARDFPDPQGGFLHVSGMSYAVDASIPSSVQVDMYGNFQGVTGPYRVKNILIQGKPLKEDALYSLASHDYLLKRGGDGLAMFKGAKVLKDMFMTDSEILIKYITENLQGKVGAKYAKPHGEQRIRFLP